MAIPVSMVRGIGPKTAAYLAAKKVKTVKQLLDINIEMLAAAPGIGPARAESVLAEAARLAGSAAASGNVSGSQKQKASKDKKGNKGKKDKKKNRKEKKGRKNKKEKKKNKKNKA